MSPCVASAGKLRGGAALGDVGAAVFDFQMETQAGGGALFLLREFFRKKAFGDRERTLEFRTVLQFHFCSHLPVFPILKTGGNA